MTKIFKVFKLLNNSSMFRYIDISISIAIYLHPWERAMRIESFRIIKTLKTQKKKKRHRTPGADGRSKNDTSRPVRCV